MVKRFLGGVMMVGACVGDSEILPDGGPDATVDAAVDAAGDSPVTDTASEPIVTGPINGTVIILNGGLTNGLNIEVGGQAMTTDANGNFTAPDPGPTYTAALRYQVSGLGAKTYIIYQGLTTRTPTLVADLVATTTDVTLSATAKGAPATGSGQNGYVVFSNVAQATSVGVAGGTITPNGQPQIGKNPPPPLTAYFYEQLINDAGNVGSYPFLASAPNLSPDDGGNVDASFTNDITGASTISITYTLPSGTGWTASTELWGAFGASNNVVLDTTNTGNSGTFASPKTSIGFKYLANAVATSSTGGVSAAWDLVSPGSNPTFVLPDIPVVTAPTTTTFALATQPISYTYAGSAVYNAWIVCHNGAVDSGANEVYDVRVFTSATSFMAPTDSALSLTLPPSGSNCTLTLDAMTNFTTLDSAAGTTGILNGFAPAHAVGGGAHSTSPVVAFTTQ